MDPTEYQFLAARTECYQGASLARIIEHHPMSTRLIHAAYGLAGDAGEIAGVVERWINYGQELDRTNLLEEVGDCLWYLALICNALGITMEFVMEQNIHKLQHRYPEKFDGELAKEENRDRDGERAVLECSEETDRYSSPSYARLCNRCQMNPIHNNNQLGLCPDCAALARAEEVENA